MWLVLREIVVTLGRCGLLELPLGDFGHSRCMRFGISAPEFDGNLWGGPVRPTEDPLLDTNDQVVAVE